VKAAATDYKMI